MPTKRQNMSVSIPTAEVLAWADPDVISQGLFLDQDAEDIYRPHISRIQLDAEADDGKNMAGKAVAFPVAEAAIIAPATDFTPAELAAKRLSQSHLATILAYDRLHFTDIYRDLTQPGRKRLKAKNLVAKQSHAEAKFHETLDVAANTLRLDAGLLEDAHAVMDHNLHDDSTERASDYWVRYLVVAGLHNSAKRYKTRLSLSRTDRDIARLSLYAEPEEKVETIAA